MWTQTSRPRHWAAFRYVTDGSCITHTHTHIYIYIYIYIYIHDFFSFAMVSYHRIIWGARVQGSEGYSPENHQQSPQRWYPCTLKRRNHLTQIRNVTGLVFRYRKWTICKGWLENVFQSKGLREYKFNHAKVGKKSILQCKGWRENEFHNAEVGENISFTM
jgi:hypothetical protein